MRARPPRLPLLTGRCGAAGRAAALAADFVKDEDSVWWLLQVYSFALEPATLARVLAAAEAEDSPAKAAARARLGELYVEEDAPHADGGGPRVMRLAPAGRHCWACRARYTAADRIAVRDGRDATGVVDAAEDARWRRGVRDSAQGLHGLERGAGRGGGTVGGGSGGGRRPFGDEDVGAVSRVHAMMRRWRARAAPGAVLHEMGEATRFEFLTRALEEEEAPADGAADAAGYSLSVGMLQTTVRHLRLRGIALACHAHLQHVPLMVPSAPYHLVSVCRLCYELYRGETALDDVSSAMARALAVPRVVALPVAHAHAHAGTEGGPTLTDAALLPGVDAASALSHESYTAIARVPSASVPLPPCVQYRLVIMFRAIERLGALPANAPRTLEARYCVFTHEHVFPVPMASDAGSRRVNAVRLHYFVASPQALLAFVTTRKITVRLFAPGALPGAQPLATGPLHFGAFAASAVSLTQAKVEYLLPLASALYGELAMRVSIGIVRDDDVAALWTDHVYTPGGGFYWPAETYHDRCPLPDEWVYAMASEPATPGTPLVAAAGAAARPRGGEGSVGAYDMCSVGGAAALAVGVDADAAAPESESPRAGSSGGSEQGRGEEEDESDDASEDTPGTSWQDRIKALFMQMSDNGRTSVSVDALVTRLRLSEERTSAAAEAATIAAAEAEVGC